MKLDRTEKTKFIVRQTLHLDKVFTDYDKAVMCFEKLQGSCFRPMLIGKHIVMNGKLYKTLYLKFGRKKVLNTQKIIVA